MAKNKRGGSAPSKSQSEDSVRNKIISIEGGLSSLTTNMQNMNANLMVNNDYAEGIFHQHAEILRSIRQNTELTAQALLGLKPGGASAVGNSLENAAESTKREEKRIVAEEEQTEEDKKQTKLLESIHKDLRKGSILDILIGAAAGLAGFVIGVVGEYMKVFGRVLKPVINFFKGQGVMVEKLMSVFRSGWEKFVGALTKLKTLFTENTVVAKVIDVIKTGWGKFTGYLKGIGSLFSEVAALWGKLFGSGGDGFLSKFFGYFKAIGERLGIFFKLGKTLGSILGKIMIPIQVILSIFDTVTGALDGWNNTEGGFIDKLFGAIKGGITGLLNGLIGGLLDLIKDGVSWLLNLMGFDELSKSLDSFSFSDLITKIVSGFFDFIKGMVNFVMDIFTNPEKAFETLVAIGDSMREFGKKVLRAVLPKPGGSGVGSWVAKAIPNSVYEYAGLNPKTGEAVQQTGETGVATKALEKTTGENMAAKDEGAAKAAAAVAASSNNSSSQVVNNNTTQAAIIKTKTTNWEPDDQWARGMAYGA
jgi:hypothetical protein